MKKSVLTRYRVMAYVTAVMLLVLCTCSVLSRFLGVLDKDVTLVVSQTHGVLFMIYLVVAFDLGQKARWAFGKLLWVLVSGTIPAAAFFVERKVSREVAPLIEEGQTAPAEA
jgi:integral membrane protein